MILHRNFEFANLRFLVSNSFYFVFANADLEERR